MVATQTSLESYNRLKEECQLGKKQQAILTFIYLHPRCTDRDIVKGTGLTINCVCGRRNELAGMGFIFNQGTRYDEETNRNVQVWRGV